MIKLILLNILLIIVIQTYTVYTKYGAIEYGDLYQELTVAFTVVSIFLSIIILLQEKSKDQS